MPTHLFELDDCGVQQLLVVEDFSYYVQVDRLPRAKSWNYSVTHDSNLPAADSYNYTLTHSYRNHKHPAEMRVRRPGTRSRVLPRPVSCPTRCFAHNLSRIMCKAPALDGACFPQTKPIGTHSTAGHLRGWGCHVPNPVPQTDHQAYLWAP
jgi:hypothetical protein